MRSDFHGIHPLKAHNSVGVTHLRGAPRHNPVLRPFRLPETAPPLSLPARPCHLPRQHSASTLCHRDRATWRSASAARHLNAAAVSEAHPECRGGQPSSIFTAEEASEGSAPLPSVQTPVHLGVVCDTCCSPLRVQRPPGGTPGWGQEVGPAPRTAQKSRADPWQGARAGAGGQSVTRRRLPRGGRRGFRRDLAGTPRGRGAGRGLTRLQGLFRPN